MIQRHLSIDAVANATNDISERPEDQIKRLQYDPAFRIKSDN